MKNYFIIIIILFLFICIFNINADKKNIIASQKSFSFSKYLSLSEKKAIKNNQEYYGVNNGVASSIVLGAVMSGTLLVSSIVFSVTLPILIHYNIYPGITYQSRAVNINLIHLLFPAVIHSAVLILLALPLMIIFFVDAYNSSIKRKRVSLIFETYNNSDLSLGVSVNF